MSGEPQRFDLTNLLRGKRVSYVESNGKILRLVMQDGSRFEIVQVNDHGEVNSGRFAARSLGPVLRAERFDELMKLPAAARG